MISKLPNYLTLLRICLSPFICLSFYFEDKVLGHIVGFVIFVFASATDYLDGFIARKYNIQTKFGKVFDPIADKILITSALIMLSSFGYASPILCIIIISRELLISGLREGLSVNKVNDKQILEVTSMSKLKTILQMVAISVLLLRIDENQLHIIDLLGNCLLFIATLITIYTGLIHYKNSVKYLG
ncbi:MAG: CDP-diacylglycerol--glycerol-3-phosphate 3-phosphatidyltransferase [Rickettsiaceae bacterium]|nr:CDP-diacylglycerol--glycerol-3-phosphate 3-phosphatidyltransferase [Rickettsiaceae bacterium]